MDYGESLMGHLGFYYDKDMRRYTYGLAEDAYDDGDEGDNFDDNPAPFGCVWNDAKKRYIRDPSSSSFTQKDAQEVFKLYAKDLEGVAYVEKSNRNNRKRPMKVYTRTDLQAAVERKEERKRAAKETKEKRKTKMKNLKNRNRKGAGEKSVTVEPAQGEDGGQ